MFLIDDALLLPFRGVFWVIKQLHRAAEEEREGEAQQCTIRLTELYMMLETGKISEEEFSASEKEILDRIEQLESSETEIAEPEEPEHEQDEE